MAATVQSVETTTWTASTTVTITKPTGLTVDDLLLAVIGNIDGTDVGQPTTPSGWTAVFQDDCQTSGNPGTGIFYKVADSSDVSASNFTFGAENTADNMAGVLYRIENAGGANIHENDSGSATGAITFTKTLSPAVESLLINVFNANSGVTFTSYTLTGGVTPSWTERIDTASGSNAFAVADGGYASTSDITQTGVTTSSGTPTVKNVLVVLYEDTDASGTTALTVNTNTVNDANGKADTNGTAGLISNTNTVNDVSVTSNNKNVWTNSTKPAESTWTNSSK